LSPATGGTWESSNPGVATVDSDGTVTGVSRGEALFTFTSSGGCSSVAGPVKVVEIPPVTVENKPVDTACAGTPFIFKASYTDDGVLAGTTGELTYRWEYSKNGHEWTVIGADSTVAASSIQSSYTISSITESDEGYYRFVAGSQGTAHTAISETLTLFVSRLQIVPDLRIMIAPSDSQHNVYLTSFVDTLGIISVKWDNIHNHVPQFTDDATGELNAQKFMSRRVYTYKYTAESKCGYSQAKAYVLTSSDKLPVKDNREISVCRDMESSKHIQLNQILGLEDNGQWSYPDDTEGVTGSNVKVSSSKYAGARIFNAQKAFDDASEAYGISGNPGAKAFKFKYTSAEGTVYRFTIVVKTA
jgi:hypothetical protein